MTKAELAALLRVTPRTIENYVRSGGLCAPLKVGGRALWRRSDISKLLALPESDSPASEVAGQGAVCPCA